MRRQRVRGFVNHSVRTDKGPSGRGPSSRVHFAHFQTSTVDGDDHIFGTTLFQGMYAASESAIDTAGNKKVSIGWSVRNNQSANRPGNYWNPSERSGRARDRTTKITILETFGNTTAVT